MQPRLFFVALTESRVCTDLTNDPESFHALCSLECFVKFLNMYRSPQDAEMHGTGLPFDSVRMHFLDQNSIRGMATPNYRMTMIEGRTLWRKRHIYLCPAAWNPVSIRFENASPWRTCTRVFAPHVNVGHTR